MRNFHRMIFKLTQSQKHLSVVMQLLCVNCTPFGCPVEPDVYMIIAMSSRDGATGSILFLMPKSITFLYAIVWTLSNPLVLVFSS